MRLKACVVSIAMGAALAVMPAAAGADQTITAVGTAQVRVTPKYPNRNKSIAKAVEAAHRRSIPAAITDARDEANAIAAASGLVVGAVQSVSENPFGPYGPYGPYGAPAPFGPNQYCHAVTAPPPPPGHSGRRAPRRQCFIPPFVITTLAVTFTARP